MPLTYVDSTEGGATVETALSRASSVAVDCEAAGFHRYSDRLCLVQLSTPTETFVLDPLAVDLTSFLKPWLEHPDLPVLMHGAAYDLRLLRRDLGIGIVNLVDTQVAASLLGEPGISLQALLERHLGISVSKKFQRADWAKRPLTEDMIDYAASDTRHLHDLADILIEALDLRGRRVWAEEEYEWLVESAAAPEPTEAADPVTRVKGARKLDPRAVTALRRALAWRDDLARAMDRAPFRVASDEALLNAVTERPTTVGDLGRLKGFSPRLAQSRGQELLDALATVERLDPEALSPYPRAEGRPPRPSPEVEAAFDRVKAARNTVAESLELDRGRVMSNSVLQEIAAVGPKTLEELERVSDVRRWQVDLLGQQILDALNAGGATGS